MPGMDHSANRVFISYRRDDAAGYAGRLEEALERRLGHGSVFRDVLDIAPGEDFVQAIRARLSGAQTVLVLIGPRWAGGDAAGARRIDDAQDFVRLEVAVALDSGAQVVPVLLPGATMPAEASLPAPLQPLARRNALSLSDTALGCRHRPAGRQHRRADAPRALALGSRRGACWPPRWWCGWMALRPGAGRAATATARCQRAAGRRMGCAGALRLGRPLHGTLRVQAPCRRADRHRQLPGLSACHREAAGRRA